MKISNSKKELARIISENGGWLDGCDFVVQDKDSFVCFYEGKPTRCGDSWEDKGDCQYRCGFNQDGTIRNWHQTILSRDEYFHLYPAQVEVVVVENKTACNLPVTDKPTIEQLAGDYKAKLAISKQAQEEADSHRCEAEAALEMLVAAGKALGLVLGVMTPEPALVITDWRDLQVGDVVWIEKKNSQLPSGEYEIQNLEDGDEVQPFMIKWGGKEWWPNIENREWRFIRRP